MNYPGQPTQPVSTRRKAGVAKKFGIGCGGLVGVFILSAVIAGMAGAGNKHQANSGSHHTPGASPRPTPTAGKHANQPGMPSPEPTHLAPAAARQEAARILKADDAYYQAEFNRGVTVSLNRGSADSFPAYHAWQSKAAADVQPGMTAFKGADAHFNASDESASISDWRDDNGNLASDLFTLANDSLGVGGPNDTAARAKVQADIKQERMDYAAAQRDADHVAAGK